MILGIKFDLNSSLYTRDPQDTDLGKRILQHGILLLNEIGFEAFTFKKLANEIDSTEKSVYRYFLNKHMLLLFLTSWYWEWVHYLILVNIKNVINPQRRLDLVIENLVFASSENAMNEYINENLLHKVIINEGAKSYHTMAVDEENKSGLFISYKALVKTVANIILEVNPDFPYPTSLSSNLFEMANNQIYFADHLAKLTDLNNSEKKEEELIEMLQFFASKLLT